MTEKKLTQLDKFKEAARELEADEDEARWEARLKKVAKPHKDTRASPNSVWDEAESADDTAETAS